MRRKPPFRHVKYVCMCVMSTCHVTTRIIQVLLSGASENCPLPLSTNSLFRNGKRRKLLIKDIPTLWLLQAVCRHLEPAVSSPLKEKKNPATYWSADGGTALHDNSLTPPQRGKRGGERKKDWEKTTHEDTFEDIFTHSLHTTSQHLMSLSYWRLWGLCWFLLRSSETPHANSKGREVSALLTCQKYESHSEWLTHCSTPHPMAALPHYPLKLIRT